MPSDKQQKLTEEVGRLISVYKGEPEKKVRVVCAEETAIAPAIDQLFFS
jgi:predicted  nucleic acid-binding Zn ribbon protein